MANRHMLTLAELPAFLAWATGLGWVLQPTNGPHEVARLHKDGAPPVILFARERMDPLYGSITVQERDVAMVREWQSWASKERKRAAKDAKKARQG